MQDKKLFQDYYNLVEYLYDSYEGYKECSLSVNSPKMKNLFIELAGSKRVILDELSNGLRKLNIDLPGKGTVAGVIHHIFDNVKIFLTSDDKESIIEEIRKCENLLSNQYKKVLKYNSLGVKDMLTQQVDKIENDLVKIDKLAIR